MYDLIIVGAGPAGITAAIYAARKKMNFAVIATDIGGEVAKTTIIENWTGEQSVTGEALAKKFEEHMKQFKFDFIEDEVQNIFMDGEIFKIKTYGQNLEARAVIITTGGSSKLLNIPGEKEFAGRGVSYCATCDAPLYPDKTVVVVGAGNTGLTAVLQLIEIAKKVYLFSKYKDIKADPVMVDKAMASPKAEILKEIETLKINGDNLVRSVTVRHEGREKVIPVEGVFVTIGFKPNTEFVKDLVKLDAFGQIIIDDHNQTNVPGLYAAGDCTTVPYKQIVISAGAGSNALLAAYDYLSKKR